MMEIINIFLFFLSLILALQVLLSVFVHKVVRTKYSMMNKNLEIKTFFYSSILLFLVYALGLYTFYINSLPVGVLIIPIFIARMYSEIYYNNIIYSNNEYIFIGVAMIRKSSLQSFEIEKGSNLEKKYSYKSNSISRFLPKKYVVFKLKNNQYVLSTLARKEYIDTLNTILNK